MSDCIGITGSHVQLLLLRIQPDFTSSSQSLVGRVVQHWTYRISIICLCRQHKDLVVHAGWHVYLQLHKPHTQFTAWRFDLSSVNYRRSRLSCCWSKGVEWSAKRCYVGLVAVGVQEQAEDIPVLPLLRNCFTLITFPFPSHYLPSRTVVLAILFTV